VANSIEESPIINQSVERYLDGLIPPRDLVLAEMEQRARCEHIPIVGPSVGRLLTLLIKMTGARRIFEMGSAIGYSTIWLARAAGPRCEVYYTDGDPARARDARDYFHRAGVTNRIHVQVGDALRLLRKAKGTFDVIFCDVDKPLYPAAFHAALPRLRPAGLFITDNVLWKGRVTGPATDAATRAIRRFNRLVYSSREIFPVILPLRDGVAVCRKR
jgi:caffeoyl-CoA O-methyltransferase